VAPNVAAEKLRSEPTDPQRRPAGSQDWANIGILAWPRIRASCGTPLHHANTPSPHCPALRPIPETRSAPGAAAVPAASRRRSPRPGASGQTTSSLRFVSVPGGSPTDTQARGRGPVPFVGSSWLSYFLTPAWQTGLDIRCPRQKIFGIQQASIESDTAIRTDLLVSVDLPRFTDNVSY
jgi:hypothetical protein